MFGDKFGHFLDKPLSSLTKRIPISPNTLTVIGFIITVIAALVLPYHLRLGGLLILFGGVFDMLDGIVARTTGKATKFGAFLDSVLDRFSDAVLFLAVTWHFARSENETGALVCLVTLVGAFLISYIRARAEGLGESCHTGLMERPERVVILAFGAITGWLLPVMWILLVLTYITVIQRVYYIWKVMKR
jgi:phosphatidylglycerophosphate synthase